MIAILIKLNDNICFFSELRACLCRIGCCGCMNVEYLMFRWCVTLMFFVVVKSQKGFTVIWPDVFMLQHVGEQRLFTEYSQLRLYQSRIMRIGGYIEPILFRWVVINFIVYVNSELSINRTDSERTLEIPGYCDVKILN